MLDTGTINARLRARKQLFLKEEVYASLVKNFSHSYIIDHLLDSRYARFLRPYLADQNSSPLEMIRNSMRDFGESEISDILEYCDKKNRTLLIYFLIRWDLTAFKAIFCAKIEGHVIENRLYAGVLNYSEIRRLNASTFTEARMFFENHDTGLLKMFCPAIEKFEITRNKEEFCRELDRTYYESLHNIRQFSPADRGLMKELLAIDIDRKNVMEILLLLATGKISGWTLPHFYGHLNEFFLNSLSRSPNVEEALQKLLQSAYEQQIIYGLLPFELTGELNYIERLIEKKWILFLKKTAMVYPLTFAVPAYYISLIKNEYSNVMTIVLGEQYGIVQNLVRRNLIIV